MTTSRRDIMQIVGFAAAGAILAAPVVLAVASRMPLEPVPRSVRGTEESATEEEDRRRSRNRDRQQRPNRDERKSRD
jgi:hypothetical protein